MHFQKRDFYIRLHQILETNPPNVIYDGRGKTAQEITSMFNEKYANHKNVRQIAAGLCFLARGGYARKRVLGNVVRWVPTSADIYDLN